MHITSTKDYFVSYHTDWINGEGRERKGERVCGSVIGQFMADHQVFSIEPIQCWECYTKNPETGEGGWDIVWIESTRELVEQYPEFDCIITTDYPCNGLEPVEFLDVEAYV